MTIRHTTRCCRARVASSSLSAPREAHTPPDAVEIIRRVDTVLVHKVAAVAAALTN
jgi:hypothetical protein